MVIYCAENLIDGKKYVGFTSDSLDKRRKEHYRRTKSEENSYFHNALRKHGTENFKWSILHEDDKIDDVDGLESYHIIDQGSHWSKWGYNMTTGGEGGSLFGELNGRYGMEVSEETRQLISKGKTGTNLGDDNPSCKSAGTYEITHPDYSVEIVKNLRQWCRDNGFEGKHGQFYDMCNGKRSLTYKGFWCERLEECHQRKVEKGITESTVLRGKMERKMKFGII